MNRWIVVQGSDRAKQLTLCRLSRQLQRDAGISRPDFEILLAVFEAPE